MSSVPAVPKGFIQRRVLYGLVLVPAGQTPSLR